MESLKSLRIRAKISPERAASAAGLSVEKYLIAECRPYVLTVGQAINLSRLLGRDMGEINWHEGLHIKREPLPHIVRLLRYKV